MTVKPGYMNTPMTQDLALNPWLTASPQRAAKDIDKVFKKKKDVVYILPIWRLIMMAIRHIPENIFKRLKL
jgi:short-subunit dehydrogenase